MSIQIQKSAGLDLIRNACKTGFKQDSALNLKTVYDACSYGGAAYNGKAF